MKQEYLLMDEQEKNEISKYKPEGVQTKLYSVENGKCWYVEFSIEGENIDSARWLSEVDDYVRNSFKLTVLQNDSSKYFNNRLYPLMSSFERKLRKILYMFSAINKDDESAKNIEKLEEKDFGQIFTMLFVDEGFMSAAKTAVKETNRDNFSKDDIIHLLESIEEKPVWDKLLGKDVVPTLRKQYQDIRKIRNDIMHSHDIGWNAYSKSEKLIKKINREIDEAIDDVNIKESITKKQPTFNKTLADALRVQEQFGQIFRSAVPQLSNWAEISNVIASSFNPEVVKMAQVAQQLATPFQLSPEITEVLEQSRSLSQAIAESPVLREAQENAQMMANLFRDNPGLVEAQRQADQISRIIQDNPAILSMQEQASKMAQLTQGLNLESISRVADENDNNSDGGLENGKDEDGISGHGDTEHKED
ncbi:MAG: hypothetical protein J6N21_11115 [Butyrivibrio sp.]|nr:hypothetical protein [Butyrivibrio sp.]